MITESKTVTEILTELKTLDKRIERAIDESTFIGAISEKTSSISIDEMTTNIRAAYQKVMDMVDRRNAMKAALVLSNATTNVVVDGKTYTVAEAIDAKAHAMAYKKKLLSVMVSQAQKASRNYENMIAQRNSTAEDVAARVAGGNNSEIKASDIYKQTYDNYLETNPIVLVDPLALADKITALADEIDAFALNVDTALAVINAKTIVTFQYGAGSNEPTVEQECACCDNGACDIKMD